MLTARRTSKAQKGSFPSIGIAVVTAVVAGLLVSGASAQEPANVFVPCGSSISLDKRLVMHRWALSGDCERPVRARVIDQFLGFTCIGQTGSEVCRSFVPTLESRAYDTATHFRCVEVGVRDTEDGVTVSQMREWAAAPEQCAWDPTQGLLAVEIDFDNGQVCVAAYCMAVDHLTAIGKVRLMHLITTAFRDLDLMAQLAGSHAMRGVRLQSR